jgi:hypothetical protein
MAIDRSEPLMDRLGRPILLVVGGAMIAVGALLPSLNDIPRTTILILGSLLVLAGVALPRIRELSAGKDNVSLKLDSVAVAVKDEFEAKGMTTEQSIAATTHVIDRLLADRDSLVRDAERGRALAVMIQAANEEFDDSAGRT